jgi:hypothetical protein
MKLSASRHLIDPYEVKVPLTSGYFTYRALFQLALSSSGSHGCQSKLLKTVLVEGLHRLQTVRGGELCKAEEI